MAALALTLCVPLAATAAHYPTADSAPVAPSAHAHLARTALQTPNATAWKIDGMMHTKNCAMLADGALLLNFDAIAARAPGCVIDGRMQRAAAILTLCSDRNAMAAPLHTPRATPRPREQKAHPPFCALFSLHVLPNLASPDLAMFDGDGDDGSNPPHTRPHNPDCCCSDQALRKDRPCPINNNNNNNSDNNNSNNNNNNNNNK